MAKKPDPTSRIADNKKAAFNYFFEERHEAGMVLYGWEVISNRKHLKQAATSTSSSAITRS